MRTAILSFSPRRPLQPAVGERFAAGFELPGARRVPGDWDAALRAVVETTSAELLLVDPPSDPAELEALVEPVRADRLDVVLGRRRRVPPLDQAVNLLARLALGAKLSDAASRPRAFRVALLRKELAPQLRAEPELLARLHGQLYRFGEVEVSDDTPSSAVARARLLASWSRLLRHPPEVDGDGHETLQALESAAPNYNAWLAATFGRWAGQRILEIGAGIGTITAHLAPGRELVTALELEATYIERLRNRFRNRPEVEPLQSDVNLADWAALAERRFDTIVLSNVLEHIDDDAGAVRTFARILPSGGRLLLYVPALPVLFGTLDEAVGHHRRYLPSSLRAVLEGNGFQLLHLTWMNLLGIPGWFVNGRLLKRRALSPTQLRVYDAVAPSLASAEARLRLPLGMNLFAVATRRSDVQS